MARFPAANPGIPQNQAALEITEMQLQQAIVLAGPNKELVPALIVALAINKQTLQPKRNAA